MKKIMFNDKFLLTQAVLDGRKTQTRRRLTLTLHKKADRGDALIEVSPSKVFFEDGKWKFIYDDYVFLLSKNNYPKYDVGEVVAVAQSYEQIYNEQGLETMDMLVQQLKNSKGWNNKMFVCADMMPNQIRITNVRIERLQDISDEDCLKEGIIQGRCGSEDTHFMDAYYIQNDIQPYCTPREAFAHLINKVSKKGTWERNPYVFVYDFELVKP